MIPVEIQAIIALVLLLAGGGGGFYVGYRFELPKVIEARNDLLNARANERTLQTGVDKCNASVAAIKDAGDKLTASAQAMVDELNKERSKYSSAITALNSIKSTTEQCPVAEAIITEGFK